MTDHTLYARCRTARREKSFTIALMKELMMACHRPQLAIGMANRDPEEVVPMSFTGLEYYIKEAKARQASR